MRCGVLVSSALRTLAELAGEALSPAGCAACDARIPFRSVFCAECAGSVVRDRGIEAVESAACPAGLERAVAFSLFGGAVAAALRRLKYEERPDLGRPLGHLLRRAARDADLGADLVVPVPLHARRLADRGFNQAALLAAEVAEELRAPHAPRALVRARDTPQQATLDRAGRLQNLTSAFAAREPARVRGRRVVLVDDVMTTGATLTACAEALLAAGAGSIAGLVVARSEGQSSTAPRPS
jgi:ComF family protein